MSQNDEYIVEILRDLGLITRYQVEEARANTTSESILHTLIQTGVITQEDVARALAAQNSMEFIDVDKAPIDKQILQTIEGDDARRYQALPVKRKTFSWANENLNRQKPGSRTLQN